jgi:predicted nucleic acid-binding Zn ribbon protein
LVLVSGDRTDGDQTDEVALRRRRRNRSIAIAMTLAALVVLFYVVTIVRLGGNVFNRPL